jgi:hypothetical protein
MKLTRKQLSKIIREEYLRSTPATPPGQMMTEARANMIVEQMIDEGLFDTIKAGFAALKGGAAGASEKVGEKAAAALAPAAKAIASVTASAKQAAQSVAASVKDIKDTAVKAAAEAAQKSLKDSLTAALKKELAAALQNLTKAGMAEDQAKTLVSTIAGSEIAALTGAGG